MFVMVEFHPNDDYLESEKFEDWYDRQAPSFSLHNYSSTSLPYFGVM
jgi:hypothetical protein